MLQGHKDEVNTVAWNPSNDLLASCSDDHTAKVGETDRQTGHASRKGGLGERRRRVDVDVDHGPCSGDQPGVWATA